MGLPLLAMPEPQAPALKGHAAAHGRRVHGTLTAAGFDAHKKDEINFRYIGVTERDYEWLTEQLVAVANRWAAGGVLGCCCRQLWRAVARGSMRLA